MRLIFLLTFVISSCTFSFNREKPKDKIGIEELEPIQNTKIDCEQEAFTQLEITKCKMEARLLELEY